MGNWGTYHRKACKGGSEPESGGGTTEKCECNSSGSSGSSLSGDAILRVHNTTITTTTGGLNAIATIKVTNNSSSRDYDGKIDKITGGNLNKSSTQLKINTQLQVGDILTLNGKGTAPGSSDITINGTIIVTKDGTLGNTITLVGLLAGNLKLADGLSDNIKVTIGDDDSLTATNPNLKGINVNIGNLTGTATMEISTTNQDDDLTAISKQVTITVTKLTLTKADGAQLKTGTNLEPNDTLNLEGTVNANSIDGQLTVSGTITIGSGTNGNLSSGLTFRGDVNGSQLQFENAPDGVTVQGTGTLTLDGDKDDALKNTNFSLTSDGKRALTYEPELVTKSKITLGIKTTTTSYAVGTQTYRNSSCFEFTATTASAENDFLCDFETYIVDSSEGGIGTSEFEVETTIFTS